MSKFIAAPERNSQNKGNPTTQRKMAMFISKREEFVFSQASSKAVASFCHHWETRFGSGRDQAQTRLNMVSASTSHMQLERISLLKAAARPASCFELLLNNIESISTSNSSSHHNFSTPRATSRI